MRVIADASLRHNLTSEKEKDHFERQLQSGTWEQAPAKRSADALICEYLKKHPEAWVVSNDNFKEWAHSGRAPADLSQRQVRFHIDPQDDEFFVVDSDPVRTRV